MRLHLETFDDPEQLARAAAGQILRCAKDSVAARGRFDWLLAGGTTPARTYRAVAADSAGEKAFWRSVHLYWGDERCVPHDHPESNYLMARQNLLDHVPVPPENIHTIAADLPDPSSAADQYGIVLPDRPDLVLLGMGEDGHVASLFPYSPALDESRRRAVAVVGAKPPHERITITPPVLRAARQVFVLVSGGAKAEALRRAFAEQRDFHDTPARLVRDAAWFVDREALAGLRVPFKSGASAQ